MDNNGIDDSGFYKQVEDGSWMYAPHFVYAPNFELLRELKDTYNYPVDGWSWYDKNPDTTNNII
jgi:hypothetical protein